MTATTTWPDLLTSLVRGQDLDSARAAWAMDRIMSGEASPSQVAGFLVALRAKGETVDELAGLADMMLTHAHRFEVPGRTVDIVGTGGDRLHTVNISTMAALVVAGAGLTVVKHGNRAASSSSGSADVLESLGIRLDLPLERVAALATEVGITFCFAGAFHPSMRHAGVPRRDLGIATAFNFLGPLTNPAQPQSSAIGVADARMAGLIAGVLANRGRTALLFRGEGDGLDEIAATGATRFWEVRDGAVREEVVDWAAVGVAPVTVEQLRGGSASQNASVVRDLLAGAHGPVRDTVVLNAAAGLVADASLPGTAEGTLVERLVAGAGHAERAIDDGAAAAVLERWRNAAAA
ncbi:anthranilate phosphoribosyltransferase [Cellulomonas flavigena DSM 20109]|uniref:Anthranilate phosphoribosyltransferase n=1 Tax=Cellulomonas flavigena (strain ATCC 482 / DSM 20109 / BCRC 11376 / JCM 18109 / NBRC 3775 / NCIMB 8073 / NRS 134) TaxID=446466 RepID=D5UFH1_CELFN|nr:anthranilate phosphoribosyltransferase [Cellulomonas flavigena]ADG74968.1 anthranilate phosphoribosyltransferase [Cellulomonas flavigena DSM 20109]